MKVYSKDIILNLGMGIIFLSIMHFTGCASTKEVLHESKHIGCHAKHGCGKEECQCSSKCSCGKKEKMSRGDQKHQTSQETIS